MLSDLHLDPDGLRAVATRLARVLDELEPRPPDAGVVAVLLGLPDGPALAAERERLLLTVSRSQAELTAMHAAVCRAAVTAEFADLDVARELRSTGGDR